MQLQRLVEETIKQAAEKIDADIVSGNNSKSTIYKVLDRALVVNKRQLRNGTDNYSNVLFISPTGAGKTSIIKDWAKSNGINLVYIPCQDMDPTDLGGIPTKSADGKYVQRLATTELDDLNTPNSVLFLDEYNRAPLAVRGTLLSVISEHMVPDGTVKGGKRYFPNFLFTVAAINPANGNDAGADWLDDAEGARFRHVKLAYEKPVAKDYLNGYFKNALNSADDAEEKAEIEGKIGIMNTLLSSDDFTYDSLEDTAKAKDKNPADYISLCYRSLTNLLDTCDGTKEDFLNLWNEFCNPMKKNIVETILAKYIDVKDKANSIFDDDTESSVLKKRVSLADKFNSKYGV